MFWKLFAESVVLQAVLALLFAGTTCYLFIVGKEVPDILLQALMLILGFYFGARTQLAASKRAGKIGGVKRL